MKRLNSSIYRSTSFTPRLKVFFSEKAKPVLDSNRLTVLRGHIELNDGDYDNEGSVWSFFKEAAKAIEETYKQMCRTYSCALVTAIDFFNGHTKDPVTKEMKPAKNYGLPYLNFACVAPNTVQLPKQWEEFISALNGNPKLMYLVENSGENAVMDSEFRKALKRDSGVEITRYALQKNEDVDNLAFMFKNHTNQHLGDKLGSETKPVSVCMHCGADSSEELRKACAELKQVFDRLGSEIKIPFNKSIEVAVAAAEDSEEGSSSGQSGTKLAVVAVLRDQRMIFLQGLTNYMVEKGLKVERSTKQVFRRTSNSEFVFEKDCSLEDMVSGYLETIEKKTYKVYQWARDVLKNPFIVNDLPRLKYETKCVEFENGVYDIESNTFYSDKKMLQGVADFACYTYFESQFPPAQSEMKHFNEIIKNSFPDQQARKKFLTHYGKLWHSAARRDPMMFCFGPTQCGKSTIFLPFTRVYGKERIAKLTNNAQHGKTFLRGNKLIGIFDEFSTRQLIREDALRVFENGEVDADEKYEKQEIVQIDYPIVVISNNLMQYENGEAVVSRYVKYDFTQLPSGTVDPKVISQHINDEAAAILFYTNSLYVNSSEGNLADLHSYKKVPSESEETNEETSEADLYTDETAEAFQESEEPPRKRLRKNE